jgi:hypothetical protein
VFIAIKSWLERIPHIWAALQSGADPLHGLRTEVVVVLEESGIDTLWKHLLQQVNSPAKCEIAAHQWFDAFRTLKLIRRLQETRFPAVRLMESLQTAEFMQDTSL